MSRTADFSLDYFPLDVSFFEDKRIRRLRSKFGADGPMLYLYILCHAYGGSGYYISSNDDWVEDAAQDIGCSAEKIEMMLHYLSNKTLLDSTLFDTVKVLSSHGIQAQYQKSKARSKQDIEVDGKLWLLSESETAGFIKVRHFSDSSQKKADSSQKKAFNSAKKDTKESKEKEIKFKVNQIKEEESKAPPPAAAPFPPSLIDVAKYNQSIKGTCDSYRFYKYYSERDWQINGKPLDWQKKLREWNETEFNADA